MSPGCADAGCRAPTLGACEPLKESGAGMVPPPGYIPARGRGRDLTVAQCGLRCLCAPSGARRSRQQCPASGGSSARGVAGVHLLPQERLFLHPLAPGGFSSLEGVIGYQLTGSVQSSSGAGERSVHQLGHVQGGVFFGKICPRTSFTAHAWCPGDTLDLFTG